MVDGLCPNRKSRIEAREFAKIFQVIYLTNYLFVFELKNFKIILVWQ